MRNIVLSSSFPMQHVYEVPAALQLRYYLVTDIAYPGCSSICEEHLYFRIQRTILYKYHTLLLAIYEHQILPVKEILF